MILGLASKNLQVMAANRYHAGLMVLVLLFFCTFGRCTDLTFERDGNNITLRCRRNTFPISNANFFVRTPESSNREPVPDSTGGQNGVIMFTLTPETEGYFTCQDPNPPNESSEELLLAGEEQKLNFKYFNTCSPASTKVYGLLISLYCSLGSVWTTRNDTHAQLWPACILTNWDMGGLYSTVCRIMKTHTQPVNTVYCFFSCSIPRIWQFITNAVLAYFYWRDCSAKL